MLRFWSLRRISELPRNPAARTTFCLSLSWLVLWSALDWWERQPAPIFSGDGVPLLGWYALGVLGLATLLSWRTSPVRFDALILLATGLVPLPMLLMTLISVLAPAHVFWGACGALSLYAILYLARGLRALTGRSQWLAAALGMLYVVGFVALSDVTNAIPDVWNPDADTAVSDQDLADRETALFEQAARIDQEVDEVQRDASPRPQGFFLGFAGVGDEKVFAQEIGLASRVIGERYQTGGRQVALINDERDLGAAPLASVSGLDYALHGIASHMQLDRDVLFLAISSHGSEEPSIAVSNSAFPLVDLTPQDLADALHDAGIQWRVIFVSACYAGGFIQALRDVHTIIITAAAADRTSFGCSSDSDLTYFGAALYRDALPEAGSLREAFDEAKTKIAVRERGEGEKPSNPQADFGFDLEAHLASGGRAAPDGRALPGRRGVPRQRAEVPRP